MEEEEKTLHSIFKDATNLEDLDYELPVAITKHGYFRVTQTCYIKVYVSVKNYRITNIYLDQKPNTYACKIYLHENFIFDSATIPWAVRWAVPEVGRHSLGAAFHDLLYRSAGFLSIRDITLHKDWIDIQLDQKFADNLFCILNDKMGVRTWRRFLLEKGVKLGGHFTYDEYLKRYRHNHVAVGDWVAGGGFAISNMKGCSQVLETVGNIAVLRNGDYQLTHSLNVAYTECEKGQ